MKTANVFKNKFHSRSERFGMETQKRHKSVSLSAIKVKHILCCILEHQSKFWEYNIYIKGGWENNDGSVGF